jgi:hypothetical protein
MYASTLLGASGEDTLSFGYYDYFNFNTNDTVLSLGCDSLKIKDAVNSPEHYKNGEIECIEAIKASLTKEAFRGYLKGNIEKYIWRYESKGNPKQDLEKAQWYLNRLLSTYDEVTIF